MAPWFSASAVTLALASMAPRYAGRAWLTISVQLGFVAGALVSALLTLSDRWSPPAGRGVRVPRRSRDPRRGFAPGPGTGMRWRMSPARRWRACIRRHEDRRRWYREAGDSRSDPGRRVDAGARRFPISFAGWSGRVVAACAHVAAAAAFVGAPGPARAARWPFAAPARRSAGGRRHASREPRRVARKPRVSATCGTIRDVEWLAAFVAASEQARTGGDPTGSGHAGARHVRGGRQRRLGCWLGGSTVIAGSHPDTSVAMTLSGACALAAGIAFGRPLAVWSAALVWASPWSRIRRSSRPPVSELAPRELVGPPSAPDELGFLLTCLTIYLLPWVAARAGCAGA